MLRSVLNAARYPLLVAVLGPPAAALAPLAYGLAGMFVVVADSIAKAEVSSEAATAPAPARSEIVGVVAPGTLLLMIALGRYGRFVADKPVSPAWRW